MGDITFDRLRLITECFPNHKILFETQRKSGVNIFFWKIVIILVIFAGLKLLRCTQQWSTYFLSYLEENHTIHIKYIHYTGHVVL